LTLGIVAQTAERLEPHGWRKGVALGVVGNVSFIAEKKRKHCGG
jgi:hypothetical protein